MLRQEQLLLKICVNSGRGIQFFTDVSISISPELPTGVFGSLIKCGLSETLDWILDEIAVVAVIASEVAVALGEVLSDTGTVVSKTALDGVDIGDGFTNRCDELGVLAGTAVVEVDTGEGDEMLLVITGIIVGIGVLFPVLKCGLSSFAKTATTVFLIESILEFN